MPRLAGTVPLHPYAMTISPVADTPCATPGTRPASRHTVAVSIEPDLDAGATRAPRWPRQSRVATTALVVGILAIPFGLLVYPGVLLGRSRWSAARSASSPPAATARSAGPGPASAWSPASSR